MRRSSTSRGASNTGRIRAKSGTAAIALVKGVGEIENGAGELSKCAVESGEGGDLDEMITTCRYREDTRVPRIGRLVEATICHEPTRPDRPSMARCSAKALDQREKARNSAAATRSFAIPPRISINRPVTTPFRSRTRRSSCIFLRPRKNRKAAATRE